MNPDHLIYKKQALLDALWLQFEKKIEQEWHTNYTPFGTGVYDINHNQKTKFAVAVSADIQKKLGNNGSISAASLTRFFDAKKINSTAKIETVEKLSRYLGYKNWADFQIKNDTIHELPSTDDVPLPPTITTDNVAIVKPFIFQKKHIIASFALVGVVLVGLLLYNFVIRDSTKFTQEEKQYFDKFIHTANQAQFDILLKYPPLTDSIKQYVEINKILDQFYTKKGTARADILGSIAQATRYHRKLMMPASGFSVVAVNCLTKSDATATIATEEHWFLLLKDARTDIEAKIYDSLGKQTYIFKKENDQWKIDINQYEGKARKASR